MFRVPTSNESPTFDETFHVGFWAWLTSRKADRVSWQGRRNRAAVLARDNQLATLAAKAAPGRAVLRQVNEESRAKAEERVAWLRGPGLDRLAAWDARHNPFTKRRIRKAARMQQQEDTHSDDA